jgi:hypothetical protein
MEEEAIMLSDMDSQGTVSYSSLDPTHSELAREIHEQLKVLKAALPAAGSDGLIVSSTRMEGWLWMQKDNGRWKKRWFVWRYSDAHQQWNLYAYKNKETMVLPPPTTPPRLGSHPKRSHQVSRKLADKVPSKVKSMLRTENDDPNSNKMVKVTFAHREEFSHKQQESNLECMEKDGVPTSKTFLRVFSRKTVFLLGYRPCHLPVVDPAQLPLQCC